MTPLRTPPRRSPPSGRLHAHALAGLLLVGSCTREHGASTGDARDTRAATSAVEAPAVQVPAEAKSAAADWLKEVRKVHTLVDRAETESEKDAALAEMTRTFEAATDISRKLDAGADVGVESAHAEVLSLSQDLASRAARMELDRKHGPAALTWAERGLAVSHAPTVLRANLLLDAADAHKLANEPDAARGLLVEALRINQTLLDKELETP